MKKNLSFLILLCLAVIPVSKIFAQDNAPATTVSACLHDAFGYQYDFARLKVTGKNFKGYGKVSNISHWKWDAYIQGTAFGSVTITVTNPRADGCEGGFVDSYTYTGTCTAGLFYGTTFYFDGSGSWNNYCSGSVLTTGTWSATDCSYPGASLKSSGVNPATTGKIVTDFLKISPNPVTNSANVSFNLTASGKVNITVYNSMQQPVKVLTNEFKSAGSYSAVWDTKSSNVATGVYRVVAIINNKTYASTISVTH